MRGRLPPACGCPFLRNSGRNTAHNPAFPLQRAAGNPQNFALELFEYISKNYPINWNFKCYGIYSIFELWERSLERMSYCDMDLFYKRYDMLDKKLDVLDFAINNGSLTKTQIENLINTYSEIIEKDKNLTPIQIQRLINRTKELTQYNLLHKEISSS